ncbi:MAG TPA: superoxide dismutase family protein [Terriglobia bacterium]|nr:superoxide dismutase family protein [Terriglobia bacterium]
MKQMTLVVRAILFAAGLLLAQEGQKAKADLVNAQGAKVGSAELTQTPDGVKIDVTVSGLTPGLHGFHIHAVGKCDGPDFKSAGGHFNPYGKKHGLKNPDGAHAGDMENLEVVADGTGKAEVVDKQVTLGEGSNSLFHDGGTAIVIHASPDDEMTDPAGNAGARVACGPIVKE